MSSSELVRDLSLKPELTLSNDSLVTISSRVEAAMGKTVRMELRELMAGADIYRLFDLAGDLRLSLGVPSSRKCPFKLDSKFLFDEGGKNVSLLEGILRTEIRGSVGADSTPSVSGEM